MHLVSRFMVPMSLMLAGCAEDVLSRLCINDDATFDIEEVSVLEDAMGEAGTHDAVLVSYDDSILEEGSTWRVSGVDVLVMIPASQFGDGVNGSTLTLEVFDANDPRSIAPYVLTQSLDVASLEWEDVTLTNPQVAIFEAEHKRAWWNFDFSGVIPEDGEHNLLGLRVLAERLQSCGGVLSIQSTLQRKLDRLRRWLWLGSQ